jgi:hypothetical protein
MGTRYIYHIIGKKVGCTNNLRGRLGRQGFGLPYMITHDGEIILGDPLVEILAVLTDVSDERAGDLEHALRARWKR